MDRQVELVKLRRDIEHVIREIESLRRSISALNAAIAAISEKQYQESILLRDDLRVAIEEVSTDQVSRLEEINERIDKMDRSLDSLRKIVANIRQEKLTRMARVVSDLIARITFVEAAASAISPDLSHDTKRAEAERVIRGSDTGKFRREKASVVKKLMDESFNEDDLRILCSDLFIEYDNIPGDILKLKIAGLVDLYVRQSLLDNLIEELRVRRPKKNWPRTNLGGA